MQSIAINKKAVREQDGDADLKLTKDMVLSLEEQSAPLFWAVLGSGRKTLDLNGKEAIPSERSPSGRKYA